MSDDKKRMGDINAMPQCSEEQREVLAKKAWPFAKKRYKKPKGDTAPEQPSVVIKNLIDWESVKYVPRSLISSANDRFFSASPPDSF